MAARAPNCRDEATRYPSDFARVAIRTNSLTDNTLLFDNLTTRRPISEKVFQNGAVHLQISFSVVETSAKHEVFCDGHEISPLWRTRRSSDHGCCLRVRPRRVQRGRGRLRNSVGQPRAGTICRLTLVRSQERSHSVAPPAMPTRVLLRCRSLSRIQSGEWPLRQVISLFTLYRIPVQATQVVNPRAAFVSM